MSTLAGNQVEQFIDDQLSGESERDFYAFWREYGFDEVHALNLAKKHAPIHEGFILKEKGCDLALAYEILS